LIRPNVGGRTLRRQLREIVYTLIKLLDPIESLVDVDFGFVLRSGYYTRQVEDIPNCMGKRKSYKRRSGGNSA